VLQELGSVLARSQATAFGLVLTLVVNREYPLPPTPETPRTYIPTKASLSVVLVTLSRMVSLAFA
jgi:hypothetical protein